MPQSTKWQSYFDSPKEGSPAGLLHEASTQAYGTELVDTDLFNVSPLQSIACFLLLPPKQQGRNCLLWYLL